MKMKIREPNSFAPKRSIPTADSHIESGGLAQNGTP